MELCRPHVSVKSTAFYSVLLTVVIYGCTSCVAFPPPRLGKKSKRTNPQLTGCNLPFLDFVNSTLHNLSHETAKLLALPSVQVFDREKTPAISLTCVWGGGSSGPLEISSYRWIHNDHPVNTTSHPGRYSLRRSGSYLAVIGPNTNDAGTYQCQAISKYGHVITESKEATVIEDGQQSIRRNVLSIEYNFVSNTCSTTG